jgi:hypothetical protein
VEAKRVAIFSTLKSEGLRMNFNPKITEDDIDKMWFHS